MKQISVCKNLLVNIWFLFVNEKSGRWQTLIKLVSVCPQRSYLAYKALIRTLWVLFHHVNDGFWWLFSCVGKKSVDCGDITYSGQQALPAEFSRCQRQEKTSYESYLINNFVQHELLDSLIQKRPSFGRIPLIPIMPKFQSKLIEMKSMWPSSITPPITQETNRARDIRGRQVMTVKSLCPL